MDVTGLGDPESIAAAIRAEVFATTRCTVSAGASGFVCVVCVHVCVYVCVCVGCTGYEKKCQRGLWFCIMDVLPSY